ncbi:MAG: hypothetical protein RSE47_00525 [Acidaminococcaceae bacterium]
MKFFKICLVCITMLAVQGCSVFDTFVTKETPVKTYSGWETVTIPGVVTLQVPPTLEPQNPSLLQKLAKQSADATLTELKQNKKQILIWQQKASTGYARIKVNTFATPSNVPLLGERVRMTEKELAAFDADFRQGVQQSNNLPGTTCTYNNWAPMRIDNINGLDCLTSYYELTQNNQPPVVVYTYIFFNKDLLYNIQLAYAKAEHSVWETPATDLRNTINTMTFVKR